MASKIFNLLFLVCAASVYAQLPAFPGAEGAGRFVSGGRGGDVYHVVNLNPSGPGSLADGVNTAPASGRTIVFDVSGNITLSNKLNIEKNNITLAGQTAPGKGICIKDARTSVSGNNVIIRHMRFRPSILGGDGDALSVSGRNVIIDHCSASWSSDEVLSTGPNPVTNLTVQNCLIYEGLDTSYHYENGVLIPHSMGSLFSSTIDSAAFSVHHNLYAHNRTRNPKPTVSEDNLTLFFDFRNNVIYNWGTKCGYSSDGPFHFLNMNYVANYCVAGHSTKASKRTEAFEGILAGTKIYQSANKIDGNIDGILNGENTGWGMFTGEYTPVSVPFPAEAVTTTSADSAYEAVLRYSGAFWWKRDSADARVVSSVRNETGRIINLQSDVGGWENLPVEQRPQGWDTDSDGMPDTWEQMNGLNPANPADGGQFNQNGYTNLENYLNSPLLLGALDVRNEQEGTFRQFRLQQNYPNPFNGFTTINFQIPEKGLVDLKVFNSQGREIDSRNLGWFGEGVHNVPCSFNTERYTSGVYYITLFSEAGQQTQKVVLLK